MGIQEKIMEVFHRTDSLVDLMVLKPKTFFDFYDIMKNMKSDVDYYSQYDPEVKKLYKGVMVSLTKLYKKILHKKDFIYVPDFDLHTFVNTYLNYIEIKKRTYESTKIPRNSHNSDS